MKVIKKVGGGAPNGRWSSKVTFKIDVKPDARKGNSSYAFHLVSNVSVDSHPAYVKMKKLVIKKNKITSTTSGEPRHMLCRKKKYIYIYTYYITSAHIF